MPQAALRQLCTRFCAKEIIRRLPATVSPILPQNGNHGAAKGNDLRFSVLRVAVEHNAAVQIHVPNLYRPDRRGAAPAVQKKIDNHPVPIFRKGRFANVGLFQQCGQLRIRIGFLHGFLGLVQGDIQTGQPLLIAPREKGFQNPHVAVDTIWRKPRLPHGNNHIVQICLVGVVQDECNLPFMFSPADIETIMRQIYAQWDTDRYWELLNRFDLPVKQELGSFSKGMKVKMNFAIALAHHAELLLLDEATSGLDPVMRDDMLDLLLDFVQSEERGVFFSTHIMSDLSKIADYIAFLHEGRLLFFESKDELIYHYGLIHCGEKLFREIDRGDILAWRKQDYEYQILVADREAAARKYKGCVIDPATLDDIMLLYIKGGSL